MNTSIIDSAQVQFAQDIKLGLQAQKKFIPSKYLYGSSGDDLFSRIMKLPEYYLTRCEAEILQENKAKILATAEFTNQHTVVDLGAGDGIKTQILLDEASSSYGSVNFTPVDISYQSLMHLSNTIKEKHPKAAIMHYCGDFYDEQFLQTIFTSSGPKLILFLGSNIGNMTFDQSVSFLSTISSLMRSQDRLLVGFDMHKDESIVLPAYNDSQGVTAQFNLNLLRRINKKLGGNIDVDKFNHKPCYNDGRLRAESYLESTINQEIHIGAVGLTVRFRAGEKIHTEISQKYTTNSIKNLARQARLTRIETYVDKQGYFNNVLFGSTIA